MYDSIIFNCPQCGSKLEEQSKNGDCGLKEFNNEEVPWGIAKGIMGNYLSCSNCFNIFKIESEIEIPATIKLILK